MHEKKKKKKKKNQVLYAYLLAVLNALTRKKCIVFLIWKKKIAREHSIDEIDTTVSRSLNRVNLQLPLQNLRSWGGGGEKLKLYYS